MDSGIKEYDVVALLEDTRTSHAVTSDPILLRRGQVGTVVMTFNEDHYEIEFADTSGKSYALLTIPGNKLMVLHHSPEAVAA